MALNLNVQWEVRTTGVDTNGGGFRAGAAGTDWTLQDAAQYSVTDAVTAGTTTITSATANFGTDVVGNVLYITGGTGSIAADWYEIISRTNSTTIVVDRSTGLSVGTGATLKIGGALLTIQKALDLCTVNEMRVWAKSGTYSISTALTTPLRSVSLPTRLQGYGTTRGDGTRATISVTAAVDAFSGSGSGWFIANFDIDGTSTGTNGINITAEAWHVVNCKIHHFTALGITGSGARRSHTWCEVNNNGTGGISVSGADITVYGCYVHDNTGPGLTSTAGSFQVRACLVANNTGASSDGLDVSSGGTGSFSAEGCVFYGNGRDGLRTTWTSIFRGNLSVKNCLFVNNGGFGFSSTNAANDKAALWLDYNAFFNNTSGARNNLNASAHDVTLTGDPFTNAAGNDFTLNNTAGAGAACRAAGFPGTLSGLTTPIGYQDIGVYRHQDPASGGGGLRLAGHGGLAA